MVNENVVPAAQVIMSLFPIIGVVMATFLLFFYILWNHKQKVILIRQGFYAPSKLDFLNICLLSGILLLILGLALTIFFIFIKRRDYTLLLGLLPFSIGLSLLIYYKIAIKNKDKREEKTYDHQEIQ